MIRSRERLILLTATLLAVTTTNAAGTASASVAVIKRALLSLEDRIEGQRAIEQVYWNHRIWPRENSGPKPPLSAVMSDDKLRARVEDYLKKSIALESIWHHPITARDLQAEMDRMAAHSRDPQVLSELFTTLAGNDGAKGARRIAETLARQTLVDRLIRNRYGSDAFDAWWEGQRASITGDVEPTQASYTMPEIAPAGCTPETWKPIHNELPDARDRHTAVWTGSEMIIWGGQGGNNDSDAFQSGARYDPATDSWTQTSEGAGLPAARFAHTAIWTGTEMIVWGGYTSSAPGAGVSTGGRYNATTDSWQPTSTGTNVPSGRGGHTAIWTGAAMIIWGGANPDVMTSGGRYNPSTDSWTPTSQGANLPEARYGHTAVWTGSQMIVWGGSSTSSLLNTGGRYSPSTDSWLATSIGTNDPSVRGYHTAVWTGSVMVVWGGSDATSYLNDGGRYDPSTNAWRAVSTGANVPAARDSHLAVWANSEMIVWGGNNGTDTLSTGARYNPTANTWATMSATNAPTNRNLASGVWTGSELIVWGGSDSGGAVTYSGGRYSPSSDSWTPTALNGTPPAPAYDATATWTGAEWIIWGGSNSGYSNSGRRYRPATDDWVPTSTGPNVPQARVQHTAVWTGEEMIVWGGRGPGELNTGGRYDPAGDTWLPTSTAANVPSARDSHSAVWTGTEMIIWGGIGSTYLNSGARYKPLTDSWTTLPVAGAPTPRRDHTAIWTGTQMIVYGGSDGFSLGTGGRYSPSLDQWTSFPGFSNRQFHVAAWTGKEMIVWGGADFDGFSVAYPSLGGRYSPSTNTWSYITTGPTGRASESGVWTGTHLIVWGGDYQTVQSKSGSRYDPVTNTWADITTTGAPAPRSRHFAAWTGNQMLVWGGTSKHALAPTGGTYCVAGCVMPAVYYQDADHDGFGISSVTVQACSAPSGYAPLSGDCNDVNAGINPGSAELCDGIDNDCDGATDNAPVPAGILSINLSRPQPGDPSATLSWTSTSGATRYDVVRGDLALLRSSDGNYAAATQMCVPNDNVGTSAIDSDVPSTAAPYWYLVRPANCGGNGTYEGGSPTQLGPRDPGINASTNACP